MSKNAILLFIALFAGSRAQAQEHSVQVIFSETYELANVILALTPYGIADPFEVQKNTAYYREMIAYFEPLRNHPLLMQADYSREKWDYYLSFRTDAFAFAFDETGKIRRQFEFYSQDGLHPFDDLLPLVQDFAEKSNFRQFYKKHQPYYENIVRRYKDYYMVAEMQAFLNREFGQFPANDRTLIVVSPLVGRMNCRRGIDDHTSADFPTLALGLIEGPESQTADIAVRATDIHTLFTEMDHGYVNPVSNKHAALIRKKFDHTQWDRGSGYEEGIDCFNEYMTWAVYDLFTLEHFPQVADSVNRNWHYQNNNRGFLASSLFGGKLRELYAQKKKNQRIRDLYPALLAWTAAVQQDIRVPELSQDTLRLRVRDLETPVAVAFSQPLQDMEWLDLFLFKVVDGDRQLIKIVELQQHRGLRFDGNTLHLRLADLPKEAGLYGFTVNWWGRKHALTSRTGVPAPSPTRVFLQISEE